MTSEPELRAALASGEGQRLKKANETLDKATEPLAALLVQKAMSEASQRWFLCSLGRRSYGAGEGDAEGEGCGGVDVSGDGSGVGEGVAVALATASFSSFFSSGNNEPFWASSMYSFAASA